MYLIERSAQTSPRTVEECENTSLVINIGQICWSSPTHCLTLGQCWREGTFALCVPINLIHLAGVTFRVGRNRSLKSAPLHQSHPSLPLFSWTGEQHNKIKEVDNRFSFPPSSISVPSCLIPSALVSSFPSSFSFFMEVNFGFLKSYQSRNQVSWKIWVGSSRYEGNLREISLQVLPLAEPDTVLFPHYLSLCESEYWNSWITGGSLSVNTLVCYSGLPEVTTFLHLFSLISLLWFFCPRTQLQKLRIKHLSSILSYLPPNLYHECDQWNWYIISFILDIIC